MACKTTSVWVCCKNCDICFHSKDKNIHTANCPLQDERQVHPYIKNNTLYSSIENKPKEEISGLSTHDINTLIFLSQSAMQICQFKIADNVTVCVQNHSPVVRTVWPTLDKSSTSVLMTEAGISITWGNLDNKQVIVKPAPDVTQEAETVQFTLLNGPKNLVIVGEIGKRISRKLTNSIICIGNKVGVVYYGKILQFEVNNVTIKPEKNILTSVINDMSELGITEAKEIFYKVTDKTKCNIKTNKLTETSKSKEVPVFLGGVEHIKSKIEDFIGIFFTSTMKTCPTIVTSILLYGFSGTGKTSLSTIITATAKIQFSTNVIRINSSTIFSKYAGESEENFTLQLKEAVDTAPSIVLIDDIDVLCPNRSTKITDQEKRISGIIMNFLDSIHQNRRNKVFVLATTNKPDAIDQSFRRFGRLDMEIEMPIPNETARRDIFAKIVQRLDNCELSASETAKISTLTPGYVGSDIMLVCTMAVTGKKQKSTSDDRVNFEDFLAALKIVKPSAMREAQIESPNVKWSDIGGQDDLKLKLKQALEWPLAHPESFARMGLTPPRGLLMYGPPGCSKTMIAKALATETKFNFLSIKGPELFNKYVGESERAIRDLFKKARQASPSIVFFDEIDAIGGERSVSSSGNNVQERVLAQLLTELDGVTALGNVTVVAATNRPDRIDKALIRPGRLDRIVYVPLPNAATRRDIIVLRISKMPVVFVDREEDINYLVQRTEGYSGAEVQAVCNEAAMKALEENLEASEVRIVHFEQALNIVTPRTPQSLINIYDEYTRS